jgi:hypothetical protein
MLRHRLPARPWHANGRESRDGPRLASGAACVVLVLYDVFVRRCLAPISCCPCLQRCSSPHFSPRGKRAHRLAADDCGLLRCRYLPHPRHCNVVEWSGGWTVTCWHRGAAALHGGCSQAAGVSDVRYVGGSDLVGGVAVQCGGKKGENYKAYTARERSPEQKAARKNAALSRQCKGLTRGAAPASPRGPRAARQRRRAA